MTVYRLRIKENRIRRIVKYADSINVRLAFQKAYNRIFKLVSLLIFGALLSSCATYPNTTSDQNSKSIESTISEITTYQTTLSPSDIGKYFCNNLTEYFNTYKYYKISSEVYKENEKQKRISTTKITKHGNIYKIEYIGCSGWFSISFSTNTFPQAEEILTFSRLTVLGNAIRYKIYDTFSAWLQRVEIALKANSNSYLYESDLNAAVEVENWVNSLSVVDK